MVSSNWSQMPLIIGGYSSGLVTKQVVFLLISSVRELGSVFWSPCHFGLAPELCNSTATLKVMSRRAVFYQERRELRVWQKAG